MMNNNEHNLEQLRNAVQAKTNPTYLSTKSQIVDYYREHGGKNWTRQAASALAGTSDAKSKEYKAAIRQFQGTRLHQAGRRLAPKYEAIGKTLPPTGRALKGNAITIHIEGKQDRFGGPKGKRYKTHTSQRNIDITLEGPAAHDFVNQDEPDFDDLWDAYGVDLGDGGEYSIYDASVS